MNLLPCPTCPWRCDQDATTIPGYDHALAVRLLRTVGQDDAFRHIMACHYSTGDQMLACKGYLAREGWSNLHVRLLLSKHQIDNPDTVLEACEQEGIALEPDYATVLAKLERSEA